MKRFILFAASLSMILSSCSDDDEGGVPSVEAPATYTFERNDQTTVSFSGQTTRILMGEELIDAMKDFDATEELMLQMFRNEAPDGGDVDPFSNADLNASTKSIRSKTAASRDYFSANTVESAEIRADFETWISAQVAEVFPNENTVAEPGVAGQLADGSSTRFVNAQGLEYNQLVNKSLIGALMTDQALNNYLSTSVLDEADSRTENDSEVLVDGKNYTFMEHKWDEAYGYLYGTAANLADPNPTIGEDDSFLNKYIGRVENDPDFTGIADEIFDAFKLGRAAIVAGDYALRDQQANIIRQKISEIIAIRAVFYLQQAKNALPDNRDNFALYGPSFHDLSEGYGFIYSLRFTRRPDGSTPYFSAAEVDAFLNDLLDDGPNGLWDVQPATLDAISVAIADRFIFSVAQAGE